MSTICFYFHIHQPFRIKKYRVFDIGYDHNYFETDNKRLDNKEIFLKVANKSYKPGFKLLSEMLDSNPKFKFSISITGTIIEQFKEWAPDLLTELKNLVKTERVEIIAETYYHSLAFLYSKDEFIKQIKEHSDLIKSEFNYKPKAFRNTELIYNNEIGEIIKELGYSTIITEGADHILGWRSPNFLYKSKSGIKMLLKNYKLSDDIAFRFSDKNWSEHPLTATKFAQWINKTNGNGEVVNLFMDFETIGEHQWEDTGIFEFLRHIPGEILKHPDNDFTTISEASTKFEVKDELDIPYLISWADIERDISAWRSNSMQYDALEKIYSIEEIVYKSKDTVLINDWKKMLTSDHFYYMCTKWFNDGDVHKYFNPYESPYEAYISFMNAFSDLKIRLESLPKIKTKVNQKVSKKLKL